MTAANRKKQAEPTEFKTDAQRLDFIKDKIMKQVTADTIKLKVGDLLKILEVQRKLSSDKNVEDKFWEMIEQIRQEELKNEK